MSSPFSHAMQTLFPLKRCASMKGIDRGRTVCRKWCCPLFPIGLCMQSRLEGSIALVLRRWDGSFDVNHTEASLELDKNGIADRSVLVDNIESRPET